MGSLICLGTSTDKYSRDLFTQCGYVRVCIIDVQVLERFSTIDGVHAIIDILLGGRAPESRFGCSAFDSRCGRPLATG